MISQGCTLCIKSGSMVLCMGPARSWGGPHSIGPRRAFWTRRRAGIGFRWVSQTHMIISCGDLRLVGSTRHRKVSQNHHSVQADTHNYFLRRPKAGRLHPSSKSSPDVIISCGDLRLVGSTRHRKVSLNPHSIYYWYRRTNMVFISFSTFISEDLAQYEIFRAKLCDF